MLTNFHELFRIFNCQQNERSSLNCEARIVNTLLRTFQHFLNRQNEGNYALNCEVRI